MENETKEEKTYQIGIRDTSKSKRISTGYIKSTQRRTYILVTTGYMKNNTEGEQNNVRVCEKRPREEKRIHWVKGKHTKSEMHVVFTWYMKTSESSH